MGRSAYLGQYSPTRITGWSWVMAAPFRWDAHAPVWNKSHLPVLGLHHHLYYQLLLQSTGCRRASSLLSSSAIHWLEIWLLPQFCHVAFWSFSSDGPWSCFRTVSWVTPLHSSYVGDIYMLSPGWPSTTGLSTICLRCWLSAPLLTYFLLCGQPWLHFEASSDPENVDKAQNQASSLVCACISLLSWIVSADTEFTWEHCPVSRDILGISDSRRTSFITPFSSI